MVAVHSPVLQHVTLVIHGHHVHGVGRAGRKIVRVPGLGDLRRCGMRWELSCADGSFHAAAITVVADNSVGLGSL